MSLSSGLPDGLPAALFHSFIININLIFYNGMGNSTFLFIVKMVFLSMLLKIASWMDRNTQYNTVQGVMGSPIDYLQIIWIMWLPLWNVGVLQIKN